MRELPIDKGFRGVFHQGDPDPYITWLVDFEKRDPEGYSRYCHETLAQTLKEIDEAHKKEKKGENT